MKDLRPIILFLAAVLAYACAPAGESAPEQETETAAEAPEPVVQTVASALTTEPPPILLKHRGTNLSGGEFGRNPGTYNSDYIYPSNADVDYFYAKGMRFFRIPITWERLQRSQYAALYSTDLTKLKALVTYATGKGMTVAIEPHNFARYYGQLIGSSAVPNAVFVDFWKKMATQFKANPRVMINLMNEPHTMPTEQWVSAANAAIAGIRSVGFTNMILVPGNAWTGAWHWSSNWYGTSNAVAMKNIVDPQNNFAYEVHLYFDGDAGGGYPTGECVSATVGTERMKNFMDWLRANGKRGFLGEFGAPNTPTCKAASQGLVDYVERNYDIMVGWAWWSAGPWWDEYPLSLSPYNGTESPMLPWLTPYVPCGK